MTWVRKDAWELKVPATIQSIQTDDRWGVTIFRGHENSAKLVVQYKNYEELVKFVENTKKELSELLRHGWEHEVQVGGTPIDPKYERYHDDLFVKFEGPQLNSYEKGIIMLMFKRVFNREFGISWYFSIDMPPCMERLDFVANDIELTEQDLKAAQEKRLNELNKHDKDIQELLDKINNLCNYLPDNTKNRIINKVNKLLDTYEKDLDNLKPKFGKSDSDILELGTPKDIRTLKPGLLAELNGIILSLSSVNTLITFLEELNNYKNLLNTSIDTLSENKTIEGDIKNIIYLSKDLDDKRSKEIIDKLSKYIDDTINKASLDITTILDNNNLVLPDNLDYKTEFKLNISKLYDELYSESKKIKPYKILLDSLTNNKEEYSTGNDIIDIINSTKYIISKLSNSKYKTDLEKRLNQIIKKHIDIINNIISNKELLENTKYKKIEENIRDDLQPLLETINKYAYLDNYELDKANKTNMLSQLLVCIDIINNNKLVELNEENKLQPITSYIIEINNKLISNKLIDNNTKKEIRNELLEKLNDGVALLEDKKIDTLEEYNQVLGIIMKSIAGIDLNIDQFTQDMEEYNQYSK